MLKFGVITEDLLPKPIRELQPPYPTFVDLPCIEIEEPRMDGNINYKLMYLTRIWNLTKKVIQERYSKDPTRIYQLYFLSSAFEKPVIADYIILKKLIELNDIVVVVTFL